MRRHDLHAVTVEDVLNRGMQVARHACAHRRAFCLHVDGELVGDIEIGQRSLCHHRRRVGGDFGNRLGGLHQHGVNLAPRCVIADGDTGVENKTAALRRARKIARHIRQHQRIGQRDFLAQTGAQARHKQTQFCDGAFVFLNTDVFTDQQRTRVGQDHAAGDLADDARGADRHHDADYYREAFEGFGLCAG